MDYHMQFMEFLYLLQKRGLSYAIYEIYFTSPKAWTIIYNFWNLLFSPKMLTIICNLWNFFPFSKNMDYHMKFLEFHSLLKKCGLSYAISRIFFKNVDYHMEFLDFFSLLQKCGLSYAIYGISFPSPKTWTVICNFWNFFPFF